APRAEGGRARGHVRSSLSNWGIFADATAVRDQTVVLNEGRLRRRVRRADFQHVDDGGDVDRLSRERDRVHGEGLGFPRPSNETGGRSLSLAVRRAPISVLFPLTSVPRGSTLPLTSKV